MIGLHLHQKLSDLGLTQQKAADMLGISQSRLNQYLKDKREPDAVMFCKICRTFQITPNSLYGFEEGSVSQPAKIEKTALEMAVLLLKQYEQKRKKSFSPEQVARIVAVIYDVIVSESAENAEKAIEWVIEAVA